MARPATGSIVEPKGSRKSWAIRFRVPGLPRQHERLGTTEEGWTREKAEGELVNVLADVQQGTWQPPERQRIQPGASLESLLTTVLNEYEELMGAMEDAVGHAIGAGEALLAAKELIPKGGWVQWLEKHLPFSVRTAYVYMNFARGKDAVSGAKTMEEGRRILRSSLPKMPGELGYEYSDELKKEARQLVARGESRAAVSRRLGVSSPTIGKWCNGSSSKKDKRKATLSREQEAAREEIENSKVPGLSELYIGIRQLANSADRLRGNPGFGEEERLNFNKALSFLHQAEYRILELAPGVGRVAEGVLR